MNHQWDQLSSNTARVRNLLLTALAVGCALVTAADGQTPKIASPATPASITPPSGHTAFLVGHAHGTQGYVCLPTSTGPDAASWTVMGARPEATLFHRFFGEEYQIITHFLSPDTNPNEAAPNPLPFGSATWQSSFDNSKVLAAVLRGNTIAAGSGQSCPNTGTIPCLLLQSIGSQQGRTGGRFMTQVSYIQRLNTKAGSAPADGCLVTTDVGKQTLVPYTADYYFFHGDR